MISKRKFQYMIKYGISSIQNEERMLNDLGREGWELAAIDRRVPHDKHGADLNLIYYFKRRTK